VRGSADRASVAVDVGEADVAAPRARPASAPARAPGADTESLRAELC
jgi:hypothetical protein